jgi:protein-tyrosine-phosphatase
MKILFVCKANVGRSQVAQVTFEGLSRHETSSAGAAADEILARDPRPSRMLKDGTAKYSIPYMKEHGIDMGDRLRTQLTPQMVSESDRVIVIMPKSDWPEYLLASGNTVLWDLPDPIDTTHEDAWRIFDEVVERVHALAKEIG